MKRAPNTIDKHVGSRLKMRRILAGLSQEKLGDALGLTFQQVQKYEKGSNRIGASRLLAIARVLNVNVDYFYEGLPMEDTAATTDLPSNDLFLASPDNLHLLQQFCQIKDAKVRKQIVDLVESISALHKAM